MIEKIKGYIAPFFDDSDRILSIFGILSVMLLSLVLLYNVIHIFKKYKKRRILNATNINLVGTFASVLVMLWAVYYCGEESVTRGDGWKTSLVSLHHALRLLGFDGGYKEFVGMIGNAASESLIKLYSFHAAVLYIYSPILTLSFVSTLLKNISAHFHYGITFFREPHIFSELNERSLALAKSISAKYGKRAKIVFANILDKNEIEHVDLVEQAKELGAIIFRKDISVINFRWRLTHFLFKKRMSFYLISEDENEKIIHASHIREKYDWKRVFLYVFSDDVCCEMLLSAKNQKNIKIARINDIQALIYHNLDEYGTRLFQNAAIKNDYKISAVIVGLGRYGSEMLKALTWYCQFPGFEVKINAFEVDPKAKEKLMLKCPELLSHSGKKASGDSEYSIEIHSGVDVESAEFIKKIESIDDATFVFICLGEDKRNLAVAKKLRETYEYMNICPDIETVVYNTDTSNKINYKWNRVVKEEMAITNNAKFSGVKNHKSQPLRIHTIGDLESFYSADALPLENQKSEKRSFGALVALGEKNDESWSSTKRSRGLAACDDCLKKLKMVEPEFIEVEIEKIASDFILDLEDINKKKKLKKRIKYLKELVNKDRPFWRFEYNYRSSLAKALHKEMRDQMLELAANDKELFSRSISNEPQGAHINIGCPKANDDEGFNKAFESLKRSHMPEITRYALDFPRLEGKVEGYDRNTLCRMDLLCIGELEHRRWCAYMRTEGYRSHAKNGTNDRNDLGKIHNNICSSYQLDDKTLRYDI